MRHAGSDVEIAEEQKGHRIQPNVPHVSDAQGRNRDSRARELRPFQRSVIKKIWSLFPDFKDVASPWHLFNSQWVEMV